MEKKNYEQSKKLDNVCYDIRGPVMDEAMRMEARGANILKLNIGNPAPFGFYAPDEVILDMIYNLRNCEGYSDSRGLFSARKAIMQYCQLKGIPNVGINDIFTGNGVSELITLTMQGLLDDGDEILVPAPDYPLWTASITLAGGKAVHYLCDEQQDWYPDINDLRSKVTPRTKGIVVINPNNPTGAVFSKEEVSEIARLAKKYDVAILADELYSRQILEKDFTYTHMRSLPEKPDKLITIMGPSKTESLSGFRLGVGYGTPEIITRMEKLQAVVSLRCAGYNQAAFYRWFSEPEGWMEKRIADHRQIRDDILKVINSCPGCWARPTEGGSYIFMQLPKLKVDIFQFTKLCRAQASVTVTPGTEFGKQYSDFIRMNFSQDHDRAVDAVKRICEMVDRYRA